MDEESPDDPYELPDFTFLVVRPKWMRRAACRGCDVSMFFPERGEVVADEAREICAECPVRRECLEFSIITKERDGVWGGKSGRQRRDMRAENVDRTHTRTCIECGKKFQGNYRSKICGPVCRRKRNAMVRQRNREDDHASEDRTGVGEPRSPEEQHPGYDSGSGEGVADRHGWLDEGPVSDDPGGPAAPPELGRRCCGGVCGGDGEGPGCGRCGTGEEPSGDSGYCGA